MSGTLAYMALLAVVGLVVDLAGLGLDTGAALGLGACLGLYALSRQRTPQNIARRLRTRPGWRECMVAMGEVKTDPFARRPMLPELVGARAEGRSIVAHVRLPSDPGRWRAFGEALRRTALVGAPAMDPPREVRPGIVEFRFGLDPLPSPAAGQTTARAVPDRAGEVLIGWREGGGEVIWRPADAPHGIVAGRTRSGKGVTLRAILAQLLAHGWRVVVIDPKSSSEHVWLEERAPDRVQLVHGLEAQVEALEQTAGVMDQRQAALLAARRERRYGADLDKVQDLPDEVRPTPVLVVIDEAPAVLSVPRERGAREIHERAVAAAAAIAARGASADVHLLIAMQRADADLLGSGWLRSNLSARILLGASDVDSVRMLFPGSEAAELVTRLTGIAGRGIASGLRAEDGPAAIGLQGLFMAQSTVLGDERAA